MNRRVVGVLVSLLLAAAGTFLIVNYVRGADERAREDLEVVTVLRVDQPVPAGTPASAMAGSVSLAEFPAFAQVPGAVSDLAQLGELVTSSDLVTGEQLTSARFVPAEQFTGVGTSQVEVPDGVLEVTISLPADRAVGGTLRAGDLVSFIASFNPFTLDAVEPGEDDLNEFIQPTDPSAPPVVLNTPNTSHIVIHKALVSRVQTAQAQPASVGTATDQNLNPEQALTGNLLVTLAVQAPDVEKIVFTSEFGFVWLARESPTASEAGTRVQTRGTIYR
jgi:pilus assembly protein CpaB